MIAEFFFVNVVRAPAMSNAADIDRMNKFVGTGQNPAIHLYSSS